MDRERTRQGFTLAELLVTIAIIAILAAFGFVAVVQHQRNLKLAEDDNIARELYLAAQNNLTGLLANGTWEKRIKEADNNYFGIRLDGSNAPDGSKIEGEHDFFRIVVNQGAVADAPESGKTAWEDAILPTGSIDDTIRSGGSYLIDYDRTTAQVFAVFYTDRTHGIFLQAGDGTLTSEDATSLYQLVSGNTEGSRKHYTSSNQSLSDVCVGYYGGAVAAGDAGNGNADDTALPKATLTLSNAEQLTLSGTLDWGNNTSSTLACKIVVHGETSGKAVDVVGSENLLASQKEIEPIVLDSVTESGKHFGELYANSNSGLINGENVYCTLETQDGTVLATSNSENSLFASVTRADESGNPLAVTIANGRQLENLSQEISGITTVTDAVLINDIDWSTFAGNNAAGGQKTIYGIQNNALNEAGSYIGIASYTLSSFDGRGHGISNLAIGTNNGTADSNTISNLNAGLFSRIANAESKENARENFTVRDLTLSAPSISSSTGEGSCGFLIGSVNADEKLAVSLSNITITSPTGSVTGGSSLGGLIGYVGKGTVKINACSVGGTVSLANNVSKSEEENTGAVGGLIGSVSPTGSCSIEIQNSNVASESGSTLTSKAGSAGGILGSYYVKEDVSDTALTLDGVKVDAAGISAISGAGSAGALAGYLGADKITISNCTVNGLSSVTAEQGSAGGEVGTIANSVSSYQQTGGTFAPNKDSYTVTATSGGAGGLIGTSAAASFTLEPGTKGSVTELNKVNIVGKNAGGIIGTLNGKASGSLSHAAFSAMSAEIQGSQYAGGILGYGENTSTQVDSALQFVGNSVQCGNLTVGENSTQNSAGGMIGCYEGNIFLHSLTLRVASALAGNEDTESAGILSIQAGQNAGGLAGSLKGNTVSVNTVTINGGDNAKSTVTGGTTAGGLVGTVVSSRKLSVTGAAVSTYVYQGGGADNAAAGGLIGSVSADKAEITSSYVGGRTYDKDDTAIGQYYDKTESHDRQGRFNVWSDGGTGSASGGFLGKLGSTNLTITNCYTTASVYSKDSSSYAGGFLGMTANGSKGEITNTYATGLVGSTEGTKGCYAGSVESGITGTANYYLGGINLSASAMGLENKNFTVTAVSTGKEFTEGKIVAAKKAKAVPYDKKLGTSYPLKITAQLAGTKGGYHMGDWPIPSEIDIKKTFVAADFADENGQRLTTPLFVEKGKSADNRQSDKMSEAVTALNKDGLTLVSWKNQADESTVTKESAIWDKLDTSLTLFANTQKNDSLTFYIINPNTNQPEKIGTAAYTQENGAVMPKLPEFEGYEKDTWYLDANKQNKIVPIIENDSFKLPESASTGEVYLTYKSGSDTYKVTIELRADSKEANYPLVYGRFVYEIEKGESKDIDLPLPDSAALSGLSLSDKPLQEKISGENDSFTLQDVQDRTAASLDRKNNQIHIQGKEEVTYVVLYTGQQVNYTIKRVFENTTAGTDTNSLTFSRNTFRTVTITGEGIVGSILDLGQYETEVPGFTVSGLGSAYLDKDPSKNVFTITYTRNRHALIKDSDGVTSMKPILLYYGESLWNKDGESVDGYLGAEATVLKENEQKKTGYYLDPYSPWLYQNDNKAVPNDAVMPDEDLTVKANWIANPTASYTVEVWQQKVDSDQKWDVKPDSKEDYDFYGTFTISADDKYFAANSNKVPIWLNNLNYIKSLLNSKIDNYKKDFQYFTLDEENTTSFNQQNGITVTVKPDGSTVYGIYYDRNIISVTFYNDPDDSFSTSSNRLYYNEESKGEFNDYPYGEYPYTQYGSLSLSSGTKFAFPSEPEYKGKFDGDDEYLYSYYDSEWHYFSLCNVNPYSVYWVYNAETGMWELFTSTYKGLYGQDIPKEAQDRFNNMIWKDGPKSTLTMLVSFVPSDGKNTIDLDYNGMKLKSDSQFLHYKENADGTVNQLADNIVYSGDIGTQNFIFTNKYYGYDVYKYQVDGTYYDILGRRYKDTKVNPCKENSSVSFSGKLSIYHRLKTYDVYLENVANPQKLALENQNYYINSDGNVIQKKRNDSAGIFGYDKDYDRVRFTENLGKIGIPNKLDVSFMPSSLDKYGDTTGYTFGGWYKSADFGEDNKVTWSSETMPAHNVRYFARWIPPTYKVNYHIGGNSEVAFSESVSKYGSITYKSDQDIRNNTDVSSKVGNELTLVAWYTDAEMTEENRYIPSTEIRGNLDLYGKFVPAQGTQIHVTVKHVLDRSDETTEDLGSEQISLEVGKTVSLAFKDFPGTIPSGSVTTLTVTGEMDGETFVLHYLQDHKEAWNYTYKELYKYQDVTDITKVIDVSGTVTTNATNMDSKVLYGEHKAGFVIDSYTKTVDKNNPTGTFVYSPDYESRKRDTVSVIYDGTNQMEKTDWSAELFDSSGIPLPDGYQLETKVAKNIDENGNFIDAGDYKISYSLILTNGFSTITLYQSTATLRILKRPVILASGDLTVPYDRSAHALEGVKSVWTSEDTAGIETGFLGNDGDGITYSGFPSITNAGTQENKFSYQLRKGVAETNYDIQCFYGTLTVTGGS